MNDIDPATGEVRNKSVQAREMNDRTRAVLEERIARDAEHAYAIERGEQLPATTEAVFSLSPHTLAEAMELAKTMAESDFVPKNFKGRAADCLIAVQMGAEVGLKPMAALRGIAVINGRPSLYGDAMWAVVRAHPLCEMVDESYNAAAQTATCIVKRRGSEPTVRTFSQADAVKAKLWNKEGPWQQYPLRMLQMRARGFACRDAIPEALQGIPLAEEVRDYEKDVTPGQDERLAAEMSIRNAGSLEMLRVAYEALGVDDQIRLTGLVAEMKRKLAGSGKTIEHEHEPEPDPAMNAYKAPGESAGPSIKDVRALIRKGDLDAAADLAHSIADDVERKVAEDEVMGAAAKKK